MKASEFWYSNTFKIMLAGVHSYMVNPDLETSYGKITTCFLKK
jgi:hypothetical protein